MIAFTLLIFVTLIKPALPTAGGIYFWCYKLADEKNGRFMAWMAGYVYLIGLITAGMTLAWGGAQFLIGKISKMISMFGVMTEKHLTSNRKALLGLELEILNSQKEFMLVYIALFLLYVLSSTTLALK